MARSYYAQTENPGRTMTVRALVEALSALPDQDAPVVFKSPAYGAYGPLHAYSIDKVEPQVVEGSTLHIPATVGYDDDDGTEYEIEAEDQVFHPWSGVVIE